MLDDLGQDMERVDTKLDGVMKKIAKLAHLDDGWFLFLTILKVTCRQETVQGDNNPERHSLLPRLHSDRTLTFQVSVQFICDINFYVLSFCPLLLSAIPLGAERVYLSVGQCYLSSQWSFSSQKCCFSLYSSCPP